MSWRVSSHPLDPSPTDTGERPYKCWFCSYATIQSSALKIHMRRHTGEKPYVCKYANCGKRFAVLNTLVVHERTHTGYKPFKCSVAGNGCNYSSSDRCKLVSHMRKSHQIDLDKLAAVSVQQSASSAAAGQHQHHGSSLVATATGPSSVIFPGMTNGVSTVGPAVASSAPSSTSSSSSSHSLALVSGAMSSSQLLMANAVYNPFTMQNSSQMSIVNSALSGSNQLKGDTPMLNLVTRYLQRQKPLMNKSNQIFPLIERNDNSLLPLSLSLSSAAMIGLYASTRFDT